jgi:hypothetical protein
MRPAFIHSIAILVEFFLNLNHLVALHS